MRSIIAELPYTALVSLAVPSTTEFPLAPRAGERFTEPSDDEDVDPVRGRIAVVAIPHAEGPRTLLLVELPDWSVACPLTSGQLHRLTNALAGRGTRSGIRPQSVDGQVVHLTGSPELLVVEAGDHTVRIPAGPKRGLSKALKAFEDNPPVG